MRFLLGAAGAGLALAEVELGAEVELAGDGGAGLLAHQGVERAAELALVGLGQPAVEHVGDDEAEHAVAEEFEALVGALDALGGRERARMGQRAVEQVGVGEAVAEPGLELFVTPRAFAAH